jgi:DNA-binding MarR family transcriptional regulator
VSGWSVRLGGVVAREDANDPTSESGSLTFTIGDSLGYLLNRSARLLAHELAERLRPAGVAIGQWPVLVVLWARDGISQAELSRLVAIEPPTMVRTIDRMVRDGFVTRAPDPEDGRVSRIHLTQRGSSLRDELIPLSIALNVETLQRLTPDEGRTLRALLTKLLTQMDSAGEEPPPDDPPRDSTIDN